MNTSQLLYYRQEQVIIISISVRKGNAGGFQGSKGTMMISRGDSLPETHLISIG